LKGNIAGDTAEFDVTIRQAGKSSRFYSLTNQKTGKSEDNSNATVVQSLKDGVYTIIIHPTVEPFDSGDIVDKPFGAR
jgi:hypothetical protein